jgi:hypothetical protein
VDRKPLACNQLNWLIPALARTVAERKRKRERQRERKKEKKKGRKR